MIDIRDADPDLVAYVVALRKEAAKYRAQRNGARAEAEALRAELEALRGSDVRAT
jgi:hypothetical protein